MRKPPRGAAAERIRARLRQEEKREKSVEMRFSLPDPWARHLFIALCRRYGLRPYRYPRMRRQSVMLRTPQSFLDKVLWPEFQEINAALAEYLAQMTDKVIREAVYKDSSDADEVPEPANWKIVGIRSRYPRSAQRFICADRKCQVLPTSR